MPQNRRRRNHRKRRTRSIPLKANRVLNIILVAFVLIIVRIWHLTVIQHEQRNEEARRPQSRTIMEPAKRGTIVDRFGVPLAINRLQYNAAIVYAPIRQIPAVRWEIDAAGNRVKSYKRRNYINKLATIFGDILTLDAKRLEDLIHAKGALYNQIPFVLKEEISEAEYYQLKALERDWPGICVQRVPRRHYPLGRVCGDVIGYMGAISRAEYEEIIAEISHLQAALEATQEREAGEPATLPEGFETVEEIEVRLQNLRDKAYTITDYVGKAGVEGRYERELRGSCGKKSYFSDARGNFLRELPGSRKALSGRRLQLAISSELQAYAELLLIQNEQIRDTRVTLLDATQRKLMAIKKPWIKGGAIVVIDPESGEVLTLASHPRYDPNDFILSGNSEIGKNQRANIQRWFETENYVADMWDQRRPLEREYFDYKQKAVDEEGQWLTWDHYLTIILPKKHAVAACLREKTDLGTAIKIAAAAKALQATAPDEALQNLLDKLALDHSVENSLAAEPISVIRNTLELILTELTSEERLLFLDLCRLVVDEERFTPSLLKEVEELSLDHYRSACAALVVVEETCRTFAKEFFRDNHFAAWRNENEKTFLKVKREEEKALKKYAKPYIDLLDNQESLLFAEFWEIYKWIFIEGFLGGGTAEPADETLEPYFEAFANWHAEIAQGGHLKLPWHGPYIRLKESIAKISPHQRIPYLKSMRQFRDLNRPLYGKYPGLRNGKDTPLEKHLAGGFYPRYGFGYGRSHAYRQATTQGSIFKLVTAHAALWQKFQSCEASRNDPTQLNPLTITDTTYTSQRKSYVGYHADGTPLPRLYKGGRLPRSTNNNLGKMGMLEAIATSSNPYFSLLAGDILNSPNDLAESAKCFGYGTRTRIDLPGEIAGKIPSDLMNNRTGLYSMAIGQHTLVVTPLQTSLMLAAIATGGKLPTPHVAMSPIFPLRPKPPISMPKIIRCMLLDGMQRVVNKSYTDSIFSLSRLYHRHPEAISDFVDVKDQLVGKTGTAESIERIDLDKERGINMYNHVWFGGIAFPPQDKEIFMGRDHRGRPDLIVVVYLRYGGFGKEAGPIAAQMVAKWRELQEKNPF